VRHPCLLRLRAETLHPDQLRRRPARTARKPPLRPPPRRFTGTDRDQAGFIRAARDGTLFHHEVAELGLDVQPVSIVGGTAGGLASVS
jgi:Sigma-54 interaction domain